MEPSAGDRLVSIAVTVQQALARAGVVYKVREHTATETLEEAARTCGVSSRRFVRAVLLKDARGPILVVLPLTHLIDFQALEGLLGRRPVPASADETVAAFPDCEPGTVPPLGAVYGIETLIDPSVYDSEDLCFEPGVHDMVVHIRRSGFRRLQAGVRVAGCAQATNKLQGGTAGGSGSELCVPEGIDLDSMVASFTPAPEVRRHIEELYELPPMPAVAQRILQLRADPVASAESLAEVVELDPSLSAQVVRYASSPFFGYRGKLESIRDAIARVLGFDMVASMALGLAAGRAFRNPPDGPLGMRAFWRHSTYCAALVQALAKAMPAGSQPRSRPGIAYLAGLLHNFGFLLMGHLFQPEFFLLNKLVAANPETPVTAIEKRVLCMGQARDVLCMGHPSIGAWLTHSWKLPDEVTVTVCEHHNEDYDGEYAAYPNLVLVANRLLRRHGIGDEIPEPPPEALLARLGLAPERTEEILETLMASGLSLDVIARYLAA